MSLDWFCLQLVLDQTEWSLGHEAGVTEEGFVAIGALRGGRRGEGGTGLETSGLCLVSRAPDSPCLQMSRVCKKPFLGLGRHGGRYRD